MHILNLLSYLFCPSLSFFKAQSSFTSPCCYQFFTRGCFLRQLVRCTIQDLLVVDSLFVP